MFRLLLNHHQDAKNGEIFMKALRLVTRGINIPNFRFAVKLKLSIIHNKPKLVCEILPWIPNFSGPRVVVRIKM
jgi:hypothetical protein